MLPLYWVLDRVEGDQAILISDLRQVLEVPRAALPPGLKEGDVLQMDFRLDKSETERRKARIQKETENLWK